MATPGSLSVKAVTWALSHTSSLTANAQGKTSYAQLSSSKSPTTQYSLPAGEYVLRKVDCSGLICCSYTAYNIWNSVFPGLGGRCSTDYMLHSLPRLNFNFGNGYMSLRGNGTARGTVVQYWNKDSSSSRTSAASAFNSTNIKKGMLLFRIKKGGKAGHVAMVYGWSGANLQIVDASGVGSTPQVGLRTRTEPDILESYQIVFSPLF